METFSPLPAICAGNSPVPGEFPVQWPVARSFDVLFDLRPNKRLSTQWWGWWFETPSCPLWRHCNAYPQFRNSFSSVLTWSREDRCSKQFMSWYLTCYSALSDEMRKCLCVSSFKVWLIPKSLGDNHILALVHKCRISTTAWRSTDTSIDVSHSTKLNTLKSRQSRR